MAIIQIVAAPLLAISPLVPRASRSVKNTELVAESEGQLAPINGSALEIVTGRDSRGTVALRLAFFCARSIHPQLADGHGQVSRAILLSEQPY